MDIIVYIIIGSVGLLFALTTFIFDELLEGVFSIFDASFLPDGAISGTTLAGTLSGFGFAGAAASAFGVKSNGTVLVIAIVAALIMWAVAWGVYNSLHKSSTQAGADSTSNYIGLTGSVISAPQKTDSWGEMNLHTRGYSNRLYFRSSEKVKNGDSIEITDVIDSSRVTVKPVSLPVAE